MQYAEKIVEVRASIARLTNALRDAQAGIPTARAQSEHRAIEAAGEKGMGTNDKARDRAMLLALAEDTEYQAKLLAVRAIDAAITTAQAELDGLLDARREAEWTIREKLATALAGRDAPDEAHHEEDGAWDKATDSALERRLAAAPLAVELPPANPNDRLFDLDSIPF